MSRHLIGLISDTHGLVRPECAAALAGVERILHAGDVEGLPAHESSARRRDVLAALSRIAPVQAVYGNVDSPTDPALVERILLTFADLRLHVSHGHELGRPTPEKLLRHYSADIIVFGHTHRSVVHREGRRLVVNPGAAGPRRFNLRPSVARLIIDGERVEVEIVPLSTPDIVT